MLHLLHRGSVAGLRPACTGEVSSKSSAYAPWTAGTERELPEVGSQFESSQGPYPMELDINGVRDSKGTGASNSACLSSPPASARESLVSVCHTGGSEGPSVGTSPKDGASNRKTSHPRPPTRKVQHPSAHRRAHDSKLPSPPVSDASTAGRSPSAR